MSERPGMSSVLKGVATSVTAAVVIALVWWGWSLTDDPLVRQSAVLAYELKAEAAEAHELLAAENETARLETQLELIKIKIDKFVDISKVRPLTEAEQIELRAVERERDVILSRLAAKG
jgi:hypothetical protein